MEQKPEQTSSLHQPQPQQLIKTLRHIIASQQTKIFELQLSIKKWERKHRQDLLSTGSINNSKRQKNKDISIEQFIKGFTQIQQKSHVQSQKIISFRYQFVFQDTLNILQALYNQLKAQKNKNQSLNTLTTDNQSMINSQSKRIRELQGRIQSFRSTFQTTLKNSDAYQNQLLDQIKRLSQDRKNFT